MYMVLLTQDDMQKILNINHTSITYLVNNGKIPYKRIEDTIRFCPVTVGRWLAEKPVLRMDKEKYIERFRNKYLKKVPDVMAAIEEYGKQFSEPHQPKYYYLEPVKNKKHGTLYYVKYSHNGKLIYSRWNTHTNNYEAAQKFAEENRDRILAAYFDKKDNRVQFNLYKVFKTYYSSGSPYLITDAKRGRVLDEESRKNYNRSVINQFIPYLKKNKIKSIEEIDTPFLGKWQNYLLADKKQGDKIIPGIKAQTIKHYISCISKIFDHLVIEGQVKTNPCKSLSAIPITKEKIRGCYEINALKGVFNKRWTDQLSYLLNLIIYTTDMRNKEIEKIQVYDIISKDGCYFINIPESKSENGERIVPVHNFVYKKLMNYIKKTNKKNDDFIFKFPNRKRLGSEVYKKAYMELLKYTNYSEERLTAENITFYSGRHFWKTLMNSQNLGDVEEYFMGHKTNADVSKRYNHKDKQGQKKIAEEAQKIFQILDKYIFTS